jgi:hypothetical protein
MNRKKPNNWTGICRKVSPKNPTEAKGGGIRGSPSPWPTWKFSASDLSERAYWDDYMRAYEDALSATSTEWAPWYVVPVNHKWAVRTLAADILTGTITHLGLEYPKPTAERRKRLEMA